MCSYLDVCLILLLLTNCIRYTFAIDFTIANIYLADGMILYQVK